MVDSKISILIACYKSEELLENIFFKGLKNTITPIEVILHDNGGNGSLEKLTHTLPNTSIKIIGDGNNVGLNVALNKCAEQATGDYFYLPHTDMYCLPEWDTALLNAAKNQVPGTYLFCSRSIEPTQGHTDFHIIKNYGELTQANEKNLLDDSVLLRRKSIVYGLRMPIFMHRKMWEKFEDFNCKHFGKKEGVDSNYFSYAHENDMIINAYHLKVRKFWMINNSLVYHLQGKSNAQQNVDKDSNKPYEYLRNKWKSFGYNVGHIDTFEQNLFPWYQRVV